MENTFDVNVISTGSAGNCVIIDNKIMIDAGLGDKDIGSALDEIDYLLITHRHGDHLNLGALKKLHKRKPWKLDKCLYVNEDVKQKIIESHNTRFDYVPKDEHIIGNESIFQLETDEYTYEVETFKLEHDVENQGFVITREDGLTMVYATDTNTMKYAPHREYDYIVVEANYDEDKIFDAMLSENFEDRFRASRNFRHLSIQQFKEFVRTHRHTKTEIYALHESGAFGLDSPIYQTGLSIDGGE